MKTIQEVVDKHGLGTIVKARHLYYHEFKIISKDYDENCWLVQDTFARNYYTIKDHPSIDYEYKVKDNIEILIRSSNFNTNEQNGLIAAFNVVIDLLNEDEDEIDAQRKHISNTIFNLIAKECGRESTDSLKRLK